tara:strand:- start:5590 stop:6483 length:894 start_codon:yes stop_codon:yes gene_type:complete
LSRNPNNISKEGLKTTVIGIVVSILLAAVKFFGGFFGHSYALIADAIESTTDVVSSGLLYLGIRWSSKAPDKSHPYGHGKAEALVALGISCILTLAAFVITKESIRHIQTPHKVPVPFTLVVLIVVVVVKELLYRFVLKTGNHTNSDAIKADAFHHRSDAITSLAAFIGISIALWGGKGYEIADDFAAIVAAVFILYNAYKIARPALGELLDEAIEPEFLSDIKLSAEQIPLVQRVEKCRLRKMGTAYHIDMHIWIEGDKTITEGHSIAHQVKDQLFDKFPQIMDVHIHVEPDNTKI